LRSWGRYFSTQGCVDIVLRSARLAGALARGGAGSLRRARAVHTVCVCPVDHEYGCWRPAVGAVEHNPPRKFDLAAPAGRASVLRPLPIGEAKETYERNRMTLLRMPSDLASAHGAESSARLYREHLLKHATCSP